MTDQTRAAWRMVAGFGAVSLAADMVYEGARSVTGPLLASLGATAALVGLISGLGEAVALVLRLFSGAWADRSGRYWGWAFAGYAITAVCVPAMALTPFVGAAGLALACALVIAERFGKAVRSPAKTVLLARSAGVVGLGRGFGVHKALDQFGAVAGPLLVAAVIALTGAIWTGLAVLVVPGAASLVILLVLQRRSQSAAPPHPTGNRELRPPTAGRAADPDRSDAQARLPRAFWIFAAAAATATAGLVTFAVIAYHLVRDQVASAALVPVVYAIAMAASGVAAIATGWVFDRIHARVLLVLPLLVVVVPVLAFSGSLPVVLLGVLAWGGASGLQDSTVKALVADLVPAPRRGTAYGFFAAIQGGAAVVGGLAAGALYEYSVPALVAFVSVTQVCTLTLLIITMRAPSS
jgi:Major Facilitator Superfamily